MSTRKLIALLFSVSGMIAFWLTGTAPAACVLIASLAYIYSIEERESRETKAANKTLLQMQTELSDLQVKVEEMNSKVSAVAISNATKSSFIRRP